MKDELKEKIRNYLEKRKEIIDDSEEVNEILDAMDDEEIEEEFGWDIENHLDYVKAKDIYDFIGKNKYNDSHINFMRKYSLKEAERIYLKIQEKIKQKEEVEKRPQEQPEGVETR